MNARLLLSLILLIAAVQPAAADEFFSPSSETGPAVVVISGASGTTPYRWYARDVAKLGYAVALVSGKDICVASSSGCSRTDDESAANLPSHSADTLPTMRNVALRYVLWPCCTCCGPAMRNMALRYVL